MASSFAKAGSVALVALLALAGCTSSNSAGRMTVGAPQVSSTKLGEVRFTPTTGRSAVGILDKPYFISFRARNAESYGHSFIAFGELDSNGNVPYDRSGVLVPSMVQIAGFWPEGEEVAYSVGHIVPVPGGTGATDGDTEIAYLQNEMTIPVTAAEYQRIAAFMRQKESTLSAWNAIAYNCSSFTNDVAEFMGMNSVNHMLFPRNYVAALKRANPGVKTISGVDVTS